MVEVNHPRHRGFRHGGSARGSGWVCRGETPFNCAVRAGDLKLIAGELW